MLEKSPLQSQEIDPENRERVLPGELICMLGSLNTTDWCLCISDSSTEGLYRCLATRPKRRTFLFGLPGSDNP